MTQDVLHSAGPILLVLVMLLITSVLGVLSSYHLFAIRRHDLICESKRRRLEYEKARRDHEMEV